MPSLLHSTALQTEPPSVERELGESMPTEGQLKLALIDHYFLTNFEIAPDPQDSRYWWVQMQHSFAAQVLEVDSLMLELIAMELRVLEVQLEPRAARV